MSLAATMLGSYTVGHAAGAICVSGRGRSQVSNAVRPGRHVEVLSQLVAWHLLDMHFNRTVGCMG